MRKFKIQFLFLSVFYILSASHISAADKTIDININRDGKITREIGLLLINRMGYLKASDVAEIFGADLNYNKQDKKIILSWNTKPARQVQFTIGKKAVRIEGINRKMRKYPRIINGITYLPLEAIITRAWENVVDAQLNWSFSDKTLWISTDGNIADIRYYTY
ncbi:MAG: stalk domain-containing protein, partial [Elusimicrobiota bacterium]